MNKPGRLEGKVTADEASAHASKVARDRQGRDQSAIPKPAAAPPKQKEQEQPDQEFGDVPPVPVQMDEEPETEAVKPAMKLIHTPNNQPLAVAPPGYEWNHSAKVYVPISK
jgi:hypothetical protein